MFIHACMHAFVSIEADVFGIWLCFMCSGWGLGGIKDINECLAAFCVVCSTRNPDMTRLCLVTTP